MTGIRTRSRDSPVIAFSRFTPYSASRLLLYEINTRCWLSDLSDRAGRIAHLGNVPETEFAFWKRMGFTHVWLMGVWTTGSRSREQYLQSPDTLQRLSQ